MMKPALYGLEDKDVVDRELFERNGSRRNLLAVN